MLSDENCTQSGRGASSTAAGSSSGNRAPGGSGSGGGKIGDMTSKEMKAALYQQFGVKNQDEMLRDGMFKMATSHNPIKAADLKNPEKVAQLYRDHVGVIKNDPVNKPGTQGVVNGINILKYNRPWDAFGINPRDSKYDGADGSRQLTSDVKSAYRRLSMQHHPDYGGDRATMEKLTIFKNSLTENSF